MPKISSKNDAGVFGVSIIPAAAYSRTDLMMARILLEQFPHKFQIVVVKNISDVELAELNRLSDEFINGRVILIRESAKGYDATVDSLFRGDRKSIPILPKLVSLANALANKSGVGRVLKLQELLQYASVILPQQTDDARFPYLGMLKARLLDQDVENRLEAAHIRDIRQNLFNFESTLSLLTAGIASLDAMHLDAESIWSLNPSARTVSGLF
ncbi:MAG: hypothetical protein PHN49_09440 [Candidatus Omnitrophica bacterium]|nr:hypothetical protein [Candidatus Omnitrophota bacterium]MDD5671851.1 hypothetical protein [Candidatus Omnitrophota bacterium]